MGGEGILTPGSGGLKTSRECPEHWIAGQSVLENSTRIFPQDIWNIFGTTVGSNQQILCGLAQPLHRRR
jgi:hypothetical protein